MEKSKLATLIDGRPDIRKKIADFLDCSLSYVYMIERGTRTPSPKMAEKIEEFFHGLITFEELLRPRH